MFELEKMFLRIDSLIVSFIKFFSGIRFIISDEITIVCATS